MASLEEEEKEVKDSIIFLTLVNLATMDLMAFFYKENNNNQK